MIARSRFSPSRSFSKGSNTVIYSKNKCHGIGLPVQVRNRFVATFIATLATNKKGLSKQWQAMKNLYGILLETPQLLI